MDAVKSYLRLASPYCQYLGGLRWSSREDGLEHPDGTLFAFTGEVALFLEGFASAGRLIPFAHVLHLLHLVRTPRGPSATGGARLGRAFAEAGRPLRNAGAFCAVLCRDLPEAAVPVPAAEVLNRLRDRHAPIRWYIVSFHDTFFPAEAPPLPPAAFEEHVLRQLGAYGDDDLGHWLRHGRGPVREAGTALARELPPPRTLSGALASLLERPRLAGARPFVAQLVSALALPPRRLAPPELPVGGYTDVTTHGRPDQILPGQLALDEWDFLRRWADRELLYFRREEPHARTAHELVVLLDQGVRTWGDVRLVLGAAVLALGRQADRKGLPFYLAATSNGGAALDPVEAGGEALAALVEASDLTPDPGLALERVLQGPAGAARDVVLLTHLRALREEDVRAAARRAGPGTRLFALALDEAGRAELSEMKHGAPVPLRQFRIEAAPPPAPPAEEAKGTVPGLWRGHVEPVGFPFQFGPGEPLVPGLLDFDLAGRRLLAAGRQGMLYAWRTDGGGVQVLPRGLLDGRLLTDPQAVVGVAGGFVVGGRLGDKLAAFYYDFARQTCAGRFLQGRPAGQLDWQWDYSPEHHCLIVHRGEMGWSLDLGTGWQYVSGGESAEGRAREAWQAWLGDRVPPRWLALPGFPVLGGADSRPAACGLDADSGAVAVLGARPAWKRFIPLADGRPVLRHCARLGAQCRGTTLALETVPLGGKQARTLRLFRGPDGVGLGEYAMASPAFTFCLSGDGRLLARQTTPWRVEVRPVDGGGPVFQTRAGGYSRHLDFELGEGCLLLRSGRNHNHTLRWDSGPLRTQHVRDDGHTAITPKIIRAMGLPLPEGSRSSRGDAEQVPLALRYDPKRFTAAAWSKLLAVSDRFGQVAVLDEDLELVCLFFAFRSWLAGWLPDGTCFGPGLVTGRPESPGAPAKFAEALRRAAAKGEES